jgi:ADP-ribose pyrophosphatase YjhB (NUDIX family)
MTISASGAALPLDQPSRARDGQDTTKPRLGVAVLVVDSDGRLLLGRRGKQPNYGKWVIPGGGVEFGESWRRTGEREIEEETGLVVDINPRQRPFVLEVLDDREHRVILFVEARVTGGALRPSSDLLDAKFFSRDSLAGVDVSCVVKPVLDELGWTSGEAVAKASADLGQEGNNP